MGQLELDDEGGILLIVIPVSGPGVKQTSCFSRPVLRIITYPSELRRLGRWEPILGLRLRPATWRIILDEYDVGIQSYQAGDTKRPPKPLKVVSHEGGVPASSPSARVNGGGRIGTIDYPPPMCRLGMCRVRFEFFLVSGMKCSTKLMVLLLNSFLVIYDDVYTQFP